MIIIYVLIFFNLNFIHNYYQIPLLAPAALLSAYGINFLFEKEKKWIALAFIVGLNLAYAEMNYYVVDPKIEDIANILKQHTPEMSLLIITYRDLDCRNPRILYRSDRRGWSVEEAAVNPTVINRLHEEEDADYWVYIGPEVPLALSDIFAEKSKPEIFPIKETLDKVFIFNLH